jgi:Methyltransferase domain
MGGSPLGRCGSTLDWLPVLRGGLHRSYARGRWDSAAQAAATTPKRNSYDKRSEADLTDVERETTEASNTGSKNPVAAYYERYHRAGERGFHRDYSQPGYIRAPKVWELLESAIPAGRRCLDLGCGDGQTIGPWAQKRKLSYVGVDIAASAVEQARARGLEADQVDDSGRLPYNDASFDAVICLEVIEPSSTRPRRSLRGCACCARAPSSWCRRPMWPTGVGAWTWHFSGAGTRLATPWPWSSRGATPTSVSSTPALSRGSYARLGASM